VLSMRNVCGQTRLIWVLDVCADRTMQRRNMMAGDSCLLTYKRNGNGRRGNTSGKTPNTAYLITFWVLLLQPLHTHKTFLASVLAN
jgi:hypothetical protein